MAATMTDARSARDAIKRLLAKVDGFSGVGITWDERGEPAVLVKADQRASAKIRSLLAAQKFPASVQVEEVGLISLENDHR